MVPHNLGVLVGHQTVSLCKSTPLYLYSNKITSGTVFKRCPCHQEVSDCNCSLGCKGKQQKGHLVK